MDRTFLPRIRNLRRTKKFAIFVSYICVKDEPASTLAQKATVLSWVEILTCLLLAILGPLQLWRLIASRRVTNLLETRPARPRTCTQVLHSLIILDVSN